jgi:pimeloyl-ACP methyl ester carboxylesterase
MTRRWVLGILGLLITLSPKLPAQSAAQTEVWTVLAFDAKGDGRDPSLPDAAQLSYRYDRQQDILWFRVSLYGRPNEEAFGINIVVDTGSDEGEKMNWWGGNRDFKFDKLVTAWVTRGKSGYMGTIGVGDVPGVKARNINNLLQNNLQIRVEGDSVVVGLKRKELTDKMKMNLIAAVGSNQEWNDDIPNTRSATLDLTTPRPIRGLRELDLGRNNFRFPSDYKTLADNQPPRIIKRGHGRQTLILIPGVYSGTDVFEGFMTRNDFQYKFYVVTPPGLNDTPARPLPSETTSYGELTWTRQLKRDILDLIHREQLEKPVIVAHGFPGSLVADELAVQHPELLSGVIDVAVMPVQFFPSPKDPSFRKPAPPDERVEYVNESWARKWFKYVTPETWESNNYPAAMFSNDCGRSEQVRRQVESVPLEVKIRYLSEFMAADHTSEFAKLTVPLLALIPGFNEKFLADPTNGFYKVSFQDSWEPLSTNPHVQRTKIPDARALILEDQPQLADEAIATFIRHQVRHNMENYGKRDLREKVVLVTGEAEGLVGKSPRSCARPFMSQVEPSPRLL